MPPRHIDVPAIVEPPQDELDHDLKEALHKSQPGPFRGEGAKLGEITETWIEAMDKYFEVAQLQ